MTKQNKRTKRPRQRRLTLLVFLVLFVFGILLVSLAISGTFLYLMNYFGLMQPLSGNRLPYILAFLLVVSLLIAVLLTVLAGNRTMKPVKKFLNATKEIAAGNFQARIETRGPEEYNVLAHSFNDMARELGSIETMRDDFVSTISYEFKTPIVSIRGFAKLLKRDDLTRGQQQEYLDIIISESDRLTQLSGNVLLYSRLSSTDRLTGFSDFALDEQLRRAVLQMYEAAEEKQIDIRLDLEPCRITSSEEMLQQVWLNLLDNAVKFTPRGGCVDVQLSDMQDAVCVQVSDTGVGMGEEVKKHIFDKFYQGDASRAEKGNGLGLSLVQRIVELCAGSVSVVSGEGKGTVFTVTLPKQNDAAGAAR